jgi:hypothetical protein
MGSGVAMGRRGPGALPQAEKREQFARLIAQGFNNSEACRIVGINRRTRETVAARPHDHDQGWQEAALCCRGHHGGGQAGGLATVSV